MLTPLLVWALFWVRYELPFPYALQLVAFAGAVGVTGWLFHDVRVTLVWHRADAIALAALLTLLLTVHAPFLTQPISGDELYHAGRSALGVLQLQYLADTLPPLNQAWAYGKPERIFDVRLFPVEELWRAVSVGVLIALCLVLGAVRALSARARPFIFWVLLAAFAAVGTILAQYPENHPPLRLLPLFASHLVFGLSSWAFRLPSVLASVAVGMAVYHFIAARLPASAREGWPNAWALLVAAVTAFVPVTFHVSELVEASVFGYAVWVCVLLSLVQALTQPESAERWLLVAGVAVALGSLLRQPTALLWVGVFAVYALSAMRGYLHLRLVGLAQTFGLGLTAVPYFVSVHELGHVAVGRAQGSAAELLVESIRGGVGPVAVLNSTTIPWMIALAVCGALAVPQLKRGAWLFALAVPAYAVYFTIWPFLWGMGRYQAEHVTPFAALALAAGAGIGIRKTRTRAVVGFALVLLCIYTVELNSRLNQDVGYQSWPQMRISSASYFPYEDALRYVQREESEGSVVLLGGAPVYNEVALWLSGFNFTETRRWRTQRAAFAAEQAELHSLEDLRALAERVGLRFLLVQRGSKRELQHRNAVTRSVIALLEQHDSGPFLKDQTFRDRFGGIIDVYRFKP